jgi:hypothetical protein
MGSEMNRFFEEVLDKFTEDITDRVFKMIQNDKELMQQYLRMVSENDKDTVNKHLGKKIHEYYDLENVKEEDTGQNKKRKARSSLIKTYQVHKKK